MSEKSVEEILDETHETDDRVDTPVWHLPKRLSPNKLPPSLRRAKSAQGFLARWRELRMAVWVARGIPYNKLPDFAVKWGKLLYDTHERQAYTAIMAGDVMFFEAWAARMLMIDQAAQTAGLSISDRGTILHAYGVLKGYGDAAGTLLKKLGGTWPPK